MSTDPHILPADLPVPVDDGACLHLLGALLPPVALPSTKGDLVRLDALSRPTVLFFYPRTGVPGQPPGLGFRGEDWDTIPGARGCTPQSCGFRDLHAEFAACGVDVLGVSTNTTAHQQEFAHRNHMPFAFLSDERLALVRALNLPTFDFPVESGGPSTLVQRMAWYVEPDESARPRIARVWYPVFPPNENAANVLAWVRSRRGVALRAIESADRPWLCDVLAQHFGGANISSRGRWLDAQQLPGLVAMIDGHRAGLVVHDRPRPGEECELVALVATTPGRGVGGVLLDAVVRIARAAGCSRVLLTTSNDNLEAMKFYQHRGWRLAAVHPGSLDRAREQRPHLPLIGLHGIPIRDDVEFEIRF